MMWVKSNIETITFPTPSGCAKCYATDLARLTFFSASKTPILFVQNKEIKKILITVFNKNAKIEMQTESIKLYNYANRESQKFCIARLTEF